jgi:hypothetical protein
MPARLRHNLRRMPITQIEPMERGDIGSGEVIACGPERIQTMPQIAHFVWLGSPVPSVVRQLIDEFRKHHAHWDVKVWNGFPEEFPDDLFRLCLTTHQLCMRSDMIRLWVLARYGGLYLDSDIYTLRNMDALCSLAPFTVKERFSGGVANAVLGAPVESTLYQSLLEEARRALLTTDKRKRTVCGPRLLRAYARRHPDCFRFLPEHYFYIFRRAASAWNFMASKPEKQAADLRVLRGRMVDGVTPYGIHLWGIPRAHLPEHLDARTSSHTVPDPLADKILWHTGNRPAQVVWRGAWDNALADQLLSHNSRIRIRHVPEGPWNTGPDEYGEWKERVGRYSDLESALKADPSEGALALLLKTDRATARGQ